MENNRSFLEIPGRDSLQSLKAEDMKTHAGRDRF